jgi:hypothetical protein
MRCGLLHNACNTTSRLRAASVLRQASHCNYRILWYISEVRPKPKSNTPALKTRSLAELTPPTCETKSNLGHALSLSAECRPPQCPEGSEMPVAAAAPFQIDLRLLRTAAARKLKWGRKWGHLNAPHNFSK